MKKWIPLLIVISMVSGLEARPRKEKDRQAADAAREARKVRKGDRPVQRPADSYSREPAAPAPPGPGAGPGPAAPRASSPDSHAWLEAKRCMDTQQWWDATTWLEFAAKDGHPDGMYWYAELLNGYDGRARKPEEALKWAERAVKAGHPDAPALVQRIRNPPPPPTPAPQPVFVPPPVPVAGPPAVAAPAAPVAPAWTPFPTPGPNVCRVCNGQGRYQKYGTVTEWEGGWGNNPYVNEVQKTGTFEYVCQSCNGRGTLY